MAMDGDVLGAAIAQVLIGKSTMPPTPEMVSNMAEFWQAVAAEVVTHVQDNAQVLPGIAVSGTSAVGPVTGSTTGPGQIK